MLREATHPFSLVFTVFCQVGYLVHSGHLISIGWTCACWVSMTRRMPTSFWQEKFERLGIEKLVMTKPQPSVSLVKNASVLFVIVKNKTLKMYISTLRRAILSCIPASGLMKLVKSKRNVEFGSAVSPAPRLTLSGHTICAEGSVGQGGGGEFPRTCVCSIRSCL